MDLYECMSGRRSIRKYLGDPVPGEKLRRLIEAARVAPSWANKQCCHFILVTDPTAKEGVLAAVPAQNRARSALEQAPVIVVACANPALSGNMEGKPYYMLDVGIAMEHLVLAAYNEGLGTCWMGWFDEAAMKQALGVPEEIRVVAISPLGFPAESPEMRPRKSVEEMASENRWGSSVSW